MKLGEQKHIIKRKILKAMAILITICYVMEPAQKELKYVFHFISHNLQAPSHIIQHDSHRTSHNFMNYENSLTNHEHKILNLLDKIFSASSNKNKSQSKLNSEILSIKKLIVYCDYNLAKTQFVLRKQDNFKIITTFKYLGYSLDLYKPPQSLNNA